MSEWISVKYALPPLDQPVLCRFNYPETLCSWSLVGYLMRNEETGRLSVKLDAPEPYDGLWYWDNSGTYLHNLEFDLSYVSHWMRLPKPPEIDEKT